MEDPDDLPAPYRFSALRFLGWYILVGIGVAFVFGIFIPGYVAFLSAFAQAIFPMLFAAMHEGALYAKAEGRVPSKEENRSLVWPLWLWAMLIDVAFLVGSEILWFGPFRIMYVLGFSFGMVVVLQFVLLLALELFVARHFFARGARNQMEFLEKSPGP